ncbi:MAG: SDR family oxidoreductase [Acidobacteria bacterium]|nr:SDR family oxidoreductase [Acidobacteriota bacterium]
MITESLAGRRIAVTGATGFLGTALTERLLRCVPDCELVLVVRPGRRGAAQRVQRDVLRNNAFDRLRRQYAEDATSAAASADNNASQETYDEMTARRVKPLAGDVSTDGLGLDDEGRALLAGCDIVIHSAATVNFDSALDDAVEVNLLGPARVAAVLDDAGSEAHLIAVSTCYVAGSRRGAAPEELVDESPFFTDVNWRDEVDSARQARRDAEQASRSPERLEALAGQARRELGAAGIPALSEKLESLRRRWVDDQMTAAGRGPGAAPAAPPAAAARRTRHRLARPFVRTRIRLLPRSAPCEYRFRRRATRRKAPILGACAVEHNEAPIFLAWRAAKVISRAATLAGGRPPEDPGLHYVVYDESAWRGLSRGDDGGGGAGASRRRDGGAVARAARPLLRDLSQRAAADGRRDVRPGRHRPGRSAP